MRQPKNTNRSTTNLQAETPALVTPLYQLDWKLQEDTQYYQTLKWFCKYYGQEQTLPE